MKRTYLIPMAGTGTIESPHEPAYLVSMGLLEWSVVPLHQRLALVTVEASEVDHSKLAAQPGVLASGDRSAIRSRLAQEGVSVRAGFGDDELRAAIRSKDRELVNAARR